jgi:uncharacterized YigZ family protein
MQDSNQDQYSAPSKRANGEYKEKGSKFLAYLFPVRSIEDVENALEEVRQEHPTARHYCYAYRLDPVTGQYRMNDDGEPSGSAGKPIYGQLLSFEVHEVFIVVVRYFGGVKLGVGGLITAYKEAARLALEESFIIPRWLSQSIRFTYTYEQTADVQRWLHHKGLELLDPTYEADCSGRIEVPRSQFDDFVKEMAGLTYITLQEPSEGK